MTQVEFARYLGRSHQAVQKYESGERNVPGEIVFKMLHLAVSAGQTEIAREIGRVYAVDTGRAEALDFESPGEAAIRVGLAKNEQDLLQQFRDFLRFADRDWVYSVVSGLQQWHKGSSNSGPQARSEQNLNELRGRERRVVDDLLFLVREGDPEIVELVLADLHRQAVNARRSKAREQQHAPRKSKSAS